MKKSIKKIIATLLVTIVSTGMCVPAFAADKEVTNMPETHSRLVITNPESGEQWSWDISSDVALVAIENDSNCGMRSMSDNVAAQVEVNIGDYLVETLSLEDEVYVEKESDIILKTGLVYNRDFETTGVVSIYNVFGSTTNVGSYYAENRYVAWRNPGAGVVGNYSPTSASWNYSIASNSGAYNSNLPPHSMLECDVRISGMTSYRTVQVLCELDSI